eukprot:GHVT01100887.1.p1 GENE.GHVT01100887.1~~GHVT01100887.1.p1  ORF type:complete len:234 (+),score=45.11 GHVT01100887.1:1070-1771(+)
MALSFARSSRTAVIVPSSSSAQSSGGAGLATSDTGTTSSVPAQVYLLHASARKVSWENGTVDNESLGRKRSKKCCVYHRQRSFGETSSESGWSSDASFSEKSKADDLLEEPPDTPDAEQQNLVTGASSISLPAARLPSAHSHALHTGRSETLPPDLQAEPFADMRPPAPPHHRRRADDLPACPQHHHRHHDERNRDDDPCRSDKNKHNAPRRKSANDSAKPKCAHKRQLTDEK